MVETLVVIVLIVVVGVSVLAFRNRPQKGIESGISSFRRELRALAPESEGGPRAAQPPTDPPRTSGVGVLRPDPTEPVEDPPASDDAAPDPGESESDGSGSGSGSDDEND
ncbi:MAG: hypothetical protein ACSLFO_14980 [Acidimicrobiales bacterium]